MYRHNYPPDIKSIIDACLKAREWYFRSTGKNPEYLLMGYKDFNSLTEYFKHDNSFVDEPSQRSATIELMAMKIKINYTDDTITCI